MEKPLGDFHNHLVPGVDDGARTEDEALEGVQRMVQGGVDHLITTPHLDLSLSLTPAKLEERIREVDEAFVGLRERVRADFPALDFRRGFEVKVDVPDADFADRRLWLGGTDAILFEWPRMRVPPGSVTVVKRIAEAGPRPILAHPERYGGLDSELRVVEQWKEAGASLQVNYGSLVGRFGERALEAALRLLERGWVDYFSTDFHGRPHLDLYLGDAQRKLEALGFPEHFETLAGTNPRRLFRNEPPIEVPPISITRGLWDRLRGMLGA